MRPEMQPRCSLDAAEMRPEMQPRADSHRQAHPRHGSPGSAAHARFTRTPARAPHPQPPRVPPRAPPARSLPAPPCPLRAPATRSLRLAALASPQAFLGRLLRGTLHLLQSQHGLTEHENYHELCRLLARLKANYQLSELVQADCYREWISMVATFTIDNELTHRSISNVLVCLFRWPPSRSTRSSTGSGRLTRSTTSSRSGRGSSPRCRTSRATSPRSSTRTCRRQPRALPRHFLGTRLVRAAGSPAHFLDTS